jgi:diacylglycerol kinase (ATP)
MLLNEIPKKDLSQGPFLFIVNPKSGTGLAQTFLEYIKTVKHQQAFEVIVSESGEHSVSLAKNAASNGYGAVIAVGGDGSVHEIGIELIHSNVALGIIPTGSGNGVSRHLGISNDVKTATQQMLSGNFKYIDTIKANEHRAIGFCGIGIDAHVASVFASSTERGFNNYMKLTIDAFSNYTPTPFELMDSQLPISEAYTVVIANTSQFGNNAYINPKAKDDDGLLECIVISKFPQIAFPELASRLFLKNIDKSKHVKVLKNQRFTVRNIGLAPFQIDGETIETANTFTFEVDHKSLKVIVSK